MSANQYLAFGIGGGSGSPNTLSPSAYAALTALLQNGFQSGKAPSVSMNTVLRQATVVIAALAQFTADHQGSDVLDDGSVTNFKNKLKAALDALYVPDLTAYARFDNYTGSPEQSVTTNGWQKMPGGLLLQWGVLALTAGSNSAAMSLSFPRAFANGLYHVSGAADNSANGSWNPIICMFKDRSPSGVTVIADTGNAGQAIASGRNVLWHAFGYDNTI